MLAVVIGFALVQAPLAAEFFPLTKGTKLTYEERGAVNSITTDTIGDTLDLAGAKATEVITLASARGSKPISAYYKVEPDGVYLLGYSKDALMPEPMPLFKIGTGKTKWQYTGRVDSSEMADALALQGESTLKGTRTILGRTVEVLEVQVKVVMGTNAARENIEQKATYAKGIGLVELVSKTSLGKSKLESSLKLIKIEQPGG